MMKTMRMFAAVPALVLLLAACGGGDGSSNGSATDGIRTIEITALDTLRFEPASVTVQAGETVRFVVTNAGQTVHDFFVGTEEEQMEHEREMQDMGDMGDMGHGDAQADTQALTLDPGETGELTMTFEEPGEVLYGCHQPGHYAGGMVGTITVE
ncbi:Auracyanin-B [bacterium HR12]|nr:Auracyanin-B [bacterium HR12]GIU99607.1 MAG: blue copper protein [Actinomycetota bacterium]